VGSFLELNADNIAQLGILRGRARFSAMLVATALASEDGDVSKALHTLIEGMTVSAASWDESYRVEVSASVLRETLHTYSRTSFAIPRPTPTHRAVSQCTQMQCTRGPLSSERSPASALALEVTVREPFLHLAFDF
jgi:hypothetical protein